MNAGRRDGQTDANRALKPRRNALRLLFLQVPRADADVSDPGENVMLAAACLEAALARSVESRQWTVVTAGDAQDRLSDGGLLEHLTVCAPDCIAATCYLWNVERTLHLLRLLKRRLPRLRVALGGPEAARDHPLLFARRSPADVIAVGEGEAVFPRILGLFRAGVDPDVEGVACRAPPDGSGSVRWRWGTQPRPQLPLADVLPAADAPVNRPDVHGMAYLETSRGCPLRCAFCCYNLRRSGWSAISPEAVYARVQILRRRGACEIRLVDPTFNAHPQFDAVVDALARANPGRQIAFFIEIRADTLTDAQAAALAAAGVAEAEVGVQSTDPAVLRIIRRGAHTTRTLRGIGLLRKHGIRPTVDFMYALPGQGRDDIVRSLAWLERFPGAHPQFLPLLLLPGTELRDRAAELGLVAQRLPPYRVVATNELRACDLRAVELEAARRLGGFDSPTRRFAGRALPDLFADRQVMIADHADAAIRPPPAVSSRQALILRGGTLFEQRERLARIIRDAVRAEPHILWQFVLEPRQEEPLDLLDRLVAELRSIPSHWLDRLVAPPGRRILAARRLFVRPARGARLSMEWLTACDDLLASASH
ncbi:MAG: radical SAM protein [Lentisphaerae bacterium]|nr:radical SAM protein [Lentisphaerota bacterium]